MVFSALLRRRRVPGRVGSAPRRSVLLRCEWWLNLGNGTLTLEHLLRGIRVPRVTAFSDAGSTRIRMKIATGIKLRCLVAAGGCFVA